MDSKIGDHDQWGCNKIIETSHVHSWSLTHLTELRLSVSLNSEVGTKKILKNIFVLIQINFDAQF